MAHHFQSDKPNARLILCTSRTHFINIYSQTACWRWWKHPIIYFERWLWEKYRYRKTHTYTQTHTDTYIYVLIYNGLIVREWFVREWTCVRFYFRLSIGDYIVPHNWILWYDICALGTKFMREFVFDFKNVTYCYWELLSFIGRKHVRTLPMEQINTTANLCFIGPLSRHKRTRLITWTIWASICYRFQN